MRAGWNHLEALKLGSNNKALRGGWLYRVVMDGDDTPGAAYLLIQADACALRDIQEQQRCALLHKLLGDVLIEID